MKRNVVFCPFTPQFLNKTFKSSIKLEMLYDLVTAIWNVLYEAIKEANLVKLCFPDPPTPTSIMFPPGFLIALAILSKCQTASSKKTRSILEPLMISLYCSKKKVSLSEMVLKFSTGSYILGNSFSPSPSSSPVGSGASLMKSTKYLLSFTNGTSSSPKFKSTILHSSVLNHSLSASATNLSAMVLSTSFFHNCSVISLEVMTLD